MRISVKFTDNKFLIGIVTVDSSIQRNGSDALIIYLLEALTRAFAVVT